jgi:predicted nucleotidyltransferase
MTAENKHLRETLQKLISSDSLLSATIVSVYIYGSFITNELTEKSDIDCLVVAREISPELLSKIKLMKAAIEMEMKREFFVNIAAKDDFSPENFAQGFFTHRERPYYFLFELKYNFQLFYGADFVAQIQFPEMLELRVKEECVRLMKNLQYINNKLLINSETNLYSKDAALKNILFAVKIFQIFYQYRFNSYQESAALASQVLVSQLPVTVYNYVKKNLGNAETIEIRAADSIAFYQAAIRLMTEQIGPDKKTKGCLAYNDCLGYFSGKQELIAGGEALDVIIFLNGLPRPAQTQEISDYFVRNGYLFINLYYPGYWEAPGEMSFSNLGAQVIAFAQALKAGEMFEAFSGRNLTLKIGKIFLVGSSFGASVSLAAQDDAFSKIVAVSPLIDFSAHQETIDILRDKLVFFREVVRLSADSQTEESLFVLDQKSQKLRLSPEKILLVADKLDKQINFASVQEYADSHKISLLKTDSGDHGYKIIKQDRIFEQIFNFIKN